MFSCVSVCVHMSVGVHTCRGQRLTLGAFLDVCPQIYALRSMLTGPCSLLHPSTPSPTQARSPLKRPRWQSLLNFHPWCQGWGLFVGMVNGVGISTASLECSSYSGPWRPQPQLLEAADISSPVLLTLAWRLPPRAPSSFPALTVSEHVYMPKGRYQGVTVVRNNHGVLVSRWTGG